MKFKKFKKTVLIDKTIEGTVKYAHTAVEIVKMLGEIFGKYKILGYVGFALQLGVALGQIIFGYSVFYILIYMMAFNFFLIKAAKTKNQNNKSKNFKEGKE